MVMAVMSGVWVQSQMADASPLGSKDFGARVSDISVVTAGISIAGSSSMVKRSNGHVYARIELAKQVVSVRCILLAVINIVPSVRPSGGTYLCK